MPLNRPPVTGPRLPALLASLLFLSACGFGGGGLPPLPDGKEIETTAEFETYKTNDNRNRVRIAKALQPGDAAALEALDTVDPDPTDYMNLVTLTDAAYRNSMAIEVVAKLDGPGGSAERLVRLTADQSEFLNEKDGQLVTATGQYYFRGENYAWATIDDGPLLSGHSAGGLTNMMIDFDAETASINLVTGVAGSSNLRMELDAKDLPFNIRTGAYGGDVTISVWDPDSPLIADVDGSLRGNVGGSPTYSNDSHGMTTSGVYTGTGEVDGKTITVDGIYFGKDLPRANAQ